MPGVEHPGQEPDYYQMRELQLVKHRRNVAILGGAGTEKSFVLSKTISAANQLLQKKHVLACAVTNNAARNIDGLTLHKLFRAKINWEWTIEGLWDQVKRHSSTRRVLSDAKILIIDEISTVKASILEAIEGVLRRLVSEPCQSGLPFGGRQIVVSGDPFQLGAVFEIHEQNTSS